MSALEHFIRYAEKNDIKAIKANIVSVITMSEGLPKETKSDAGLNTVRNITQMNARDEVEHIGPTLRITVDNTVDNIEALPKNKNGHK